MFSNAILITEKDPEKIFYIVNTAIRECASNHEEYVTFKFDGVEEKVIYVIEKVLKSLHYSTFICYHIYDADKKDAKRYWYLKVSWNIFKKEREVLS